MPPFAAVVRAQGVRTIAHMRMILAVVVATILAACVEQTGGDPSTGEDESEASLPYRKCAAICAPGTLIHIVLSGSDGRAHDSYSCPVQGSAHDSPTPEICDITP